MTRDVSRTCRYYGIARQACFKWLRRCEAGGLEGLRDGSRGPTQSRTTRSEVVGKIVYLRQPTSSDPQVTIYLARYHDIRSTVGVWRILRRLGMNRLAASQRYRRHLARWKRYEKPLPGLRV